MAAQWPTHVAKARARRKLHARLAKVRANNRKLHKNGKRGQYLV